ncbi:MAG TPA: BadF/BadG/BcrA/BcrD ATPase family protein, partial [Armatimonadota bacterium]|nr:BadF/BadG/BcrA/BcrD ATPase family protein [Armatimonadota bacterium]
MEIVVGVDGGGSSTKALAAWTDGRLVGYGESGPSNFHIVGLERAGEAVCEAVGRAMAQVGSAPVTYYLGLAGVGRPEDRERLQAELVQRLATAAVTVVTDAAIALAGGTVGQAGVVVIAGTGSIALGIDRQGRESRSGGWGYLVGDEGGGFDIGRQGIRAALREVDGRGPATSLTDCLLQYLGLESREQIRQIVARVYQPETGPPLIAGFSRLVTCEAGAGDRVALGIVKRAARELSLAAGAVLHQLELDREKSPVIMAGGIFDADPLLAREFVKRLQRTA